MKITKTKIVFLLLLLINLIPVFCLAAPSTTYTPMEKIPGFDNPADFPAYLMSIYRFGLWAIGVSAMFMIMLGGYMYLTSAGNNSQTGKAKEVITDAIAGLVLALVSYVLLWTINPDLVKFKPISVQPGTGTTTGGGNNGGNNRGATYAGYKAACLDPTSKIPIDFNKSPVKSVSSACINLIPNDVDGISKEILRTIAQMESSCGTDPNAKNPSAESCGIMQIKPGTAGVSCSELVSNNNKSIELAAKYIKENASRHNNDPIKIFAGYNGGYASGGSGPLADSKDCSGSLKFQCCFDPQGLDQAIHYAWNGIGIYKSQ